jgi:uncharacterized membrane protein
MLPKGKNMKFTCSVEINKPVEKVLELFDNTKNLKEWQDGFVSLEHLSGQPGEPGAKSKLIYKIGKREIELIETISIKNLPQEFSALYETKTMTNTMTNRFIPIGEEKTKYETEIEYTSFNGIMPKIMAFLMPGVFKKQTQKWLDQFKIFAEKKGKSQ